MLVIGTVCPLRYAQGAMGSQRKNEVNLLEGGQKDVSEKGMLGLGFEA